MVHRRWHVSFAGATVLTCSQHRLSFEHNIDNFTSISVSDRAYTQSKLAPIKEETAMI